MMLSPRWKKILSDTWGHKTRSLLVIASITIGLFAVGVITSMQIIINNDMANGYEALDPANIQLAVSPFDQDLAESAANVEGVRQAEGAAEITLRYRSAEGTWKPLNILARPDIGQQAINRVALVEGAWPPRDKQVAVEQDQAGNMPMGAGG